MRTIKTQFIVLLLAVVLVPSPMSAQPPATQPYPLLFVHGFCGSVEAWTTMTTALRMGNPSRYGTTVSRVYFDTNEVWLHEGTTARRARDVFPAPDPTRRIFAIEFRGLTGSFEPLDVAQVPIAAKAIELKQVIDEIKRITGQSKVIVVGHSMGGLVARWYIERGAGTRGYESDVAALATIDTPHLGASVATFTPFDAFTDCLLLPSVNKAELIPGSATLTTLNTTPWRVDTPAASIASWQSEFPNVKTDAVVDYNSQNLLSVYPQLAGTSVFLLDNPISLGPFRTILHILVHQHPQTIGLVNLIVAAADRLQPTTPAPGAPQLTAIADGSGVVTLRWTPAATGGAPLLYVLRGTYRDPVGRAIAFDFPVGNTMSIIVPPNLFGTFTVRVYGRNAAGEGPSSNEVTFAIATP